jgi:3,4-dihydroxy 2-butanone 4-phosphate synthase/GTP cyclohydrolase II
MIKEAIKKIIEGNPIIIFDDGAPIPCGYIFAACTNLKEDTVLKIAQIGQGIILVPLSEERAATIGLSSISADSTHPFPITIGVEARSGVGSGISIKDRTVTIKAILESNSNLRTISAPGHIYPLPAKKGGLLVKTGIAEASVDLLNIAKLDDVGVISHILNDKGDFSTEEELKKISLKENLPIIRLSSIVQFRLIHEQIVVSVSKANLPTKKYGDFEAHCFISTHDQAEHLVLAKGNISENTPILTRMHSEKKLSDIFYFSSKYERKKIDQSMSMISKEGRGVLVYIRKAKKNLISSQLNQENSNTTSSDKIVSELREVGVGAQILKALKITEIRLLTSEKKVLNNLSPYGISVVEQISLSDIK